MAEITKFFFLTVAIATASSCHNTISRPPKLVERTITWNTSALPSNIEGAINHPAIFQLLHEGLTRFRFSDGRVTVEPAMASSWEFENPHILRVRMKDCRGLDGHFLTAKEVAEDLTSRFRSQKIPCREISSARPPFIRPIAIRAVDDRLLEFSFSEPAPLFLHTLACPEYWPSRSGPNHHLLGPFHTIQISNDEWQLDPSPLYHDPLNANLHLIIRATRDRTKRVQRALSDDYDLSEDLPTMLLQKGTRPVQRPLNQLIVLRANGVRPDPLIDVRRRLIDSLSAKDLALTSANLMVLLNPKPSTRGSGGLGLKKLALSYQEGLKELALNLKAQWERSFPIEVELRPAGAESHFSLISVIQPPTNPYLWPREFPLVDAPSAIVVSPSAEWLKEIYDQALATLETQLRVTLLARRSSFNAVRDNLTIEPSPYGGWNLLKVAHL